jgi:hypothetical protein
VQKTKRVWGGGEERRGLTFTIIVFHHNKNFRGEHPKMKKIW